MTNFLGKIVIQGRVNALTGLHIGGSSTGMEIGGVDSVIVRDSITQRPYIPGSSLKGSLRSLMERAEGKQFNKKVGNSRIHMCKNLEEFKNCSICRVFGITADSLESNEELPSLTRLIVRDAMMTDETADRLEKADTDLLFTDVKTEVVIDRLTSQATPRQIERVPAGSEFNFCMIFNVLVDADSEFLKHVFQAMTLLEDDSLGGQGSRGYGRIKFKIENISWRPKGYYATGAGEIANMNGSMSTAKEIRDNFRTILEKIKA